MVYEGGRAEETVWEMREGRKRGPRGLGAGGWDEEGDHISREAGDGR